jgi:hypothetical protein
MQIGQALTKLSVFVHLASLLIGQTPVAAAEPDWLDLWAGFALIFWI